MMARLSKLHDGKASKLLGFTPCAEAAVRVEVEEVFLIELAVRDEDGSEIVDESSSLLLR